MRKVAFSFALAFCIGAALVARAASTVDSKGVVGRTSYATLPFGSAVFAGSWGAVNAQINNTGLMISNLFWSSGSFFNNPGDMAAARSASESIATTGVVPVAVAQRWEDTYAAAQPASLFPAEPSWVVTDRANNGSPLTGLPEFQAWLSWMAARPGLAAVANDGGSMPPYYRSWGGTWGQVSPMMPLASSDCPPDMTSCTYGDWYAYRWAETSAASGAYGVLLSDFSNDLPSQPSWIQDFNPAIVAAFGRSIGQAIPGSTPSAQSADIISNLMPQWNDFLSLGYAAFFNALATRITAATGQQALVIAGGSDWPATNRFWGVDERQMATFPNLTNHLLVVWDDVTMQSDRNGASMVSQIDGPVVGAAREPRIRNGSYFSANDSTFWSAVAQFNPTLSAADQQEWGLKQLKREWLEIGWAHIANQNGNTRRALAFALRDHWDAGTIDPTLQRLVQTIYPARPFGFALYYSTAVERAIEPQVALTNEWTQPYLPTGDLLAFRNAVPLNYYVSDAALARLQPGAVPAAWIVLDAGSLMPASELAKLQSIAPVLTSASQALAFAAAPLSFSGGLTGTGFYDQFNRLIITATNPSTAADAVTISGFMMLKGLADGGYVMRDLFANTSANFTVVNGEASIPVAVTRWDTRAFAITARGAPKT